MNNSGAKYLKESPISMVSILEGGGACGILLLASGTSAEVRP